MDLSAYYKKGAYVIYRHKELHTVYYNDSGYDYIDEYEQAVIVEQPRDKYGRFTNNFEYEYGITVRIRDVHGKVFVTELENIQPDVDPAALSLQDVRALWKEMAHGSMYYSDYQNSFGIFCRTLCDYYDGYWEQMCDVYSEEEASAYDGPESFYDYCQGTEYYRAA